MCWYFGNNVTSTRLDFQSNSSRVQGLDSNLCHPEILTGIQECQTQFEHLHPETLAIIEIEKQGGDKVCSFLRIRDGFGYPSKYFRTYSFSPSLSVNSCNRLCNDGRKQGTYSSLSVDSQQTLQLFLIQ